MKSNAAEEQKYSQSLNGKLYKKANNWKLNEIMKFNLEKTKLK